MKVHPTSLKSNYRLAIAEEEEACPPATTKSGIGGGGTGSGGRGRDLRRGRGSGGGRGQCRGNAGEDDFVATARKKVQ